MKVLAGRLKQGNEKGGVWAGSIGILDSLLQPAKFAGDDNKLSDSESVGKSQVDHSRGTFNLRGRGDGEACSSKRGGGPVARSRFHRSGQIHPFPVLFHFSLESSLNFCEKFKPRST